jgi:hypothetical protein
MIQAPGAALQARARFAAVTAWRPCLPQRRTIIVIMLLHTMHMPELQALSGHRDSFFTGQQIMQTSMLSMWLATISSYHDR